MNVVLEKLKLAVKSKTIWTAIALFLVSGVGAIRSLISPTYKPVVEAVLTILIVIFKLKPSQDYK